MTYREVAKFVAWLRGVSPDAITSRRSSERNQHMGLSRSQQMSRIRSTETSPERRLRAAVWRAGLRYRLYSRSLAGKPDLVFHAAKVVVFIDGCFWHGCPDHYVPPRSRDEYWSEKLRTNVLRDIRRTVELESAGWRVVRVWECEVEVDLDGAVSKVVAAVRSKRWVSPPDWRVVRVDAIGEEEKRTLRRLHGGEDERVELRYRSFVRQGRAARARREPVAP